LDSIVARALLVADFIDSIDPRRTHDEPFGSKFAASLPGDWAWAPASDFPDRSLFRAWHRQIQQ
jgi:hypothetical protein